MKVGNSASAGMGCARALLPVKISSAIDLRCVGRRMSVDYRVNSTSNRVRCSMRRTDGRTGDRPKRKRQTVVTPVTNGSPVPTPPVGLRRFVLPL